MRLTRFNKFLPILFLFVFLCGFLSFFLKNAYGLNINVETYVVVSKDNAGALQSRAVKKAIGLSLRKAIEKLTGKKFSLKKNSNSKNDKILNKNIYSNEMKYIYSFKVIKAKSYLNLYYIKMNVLIREKELRNKLKSLGFKVVKNVLISKRVKYHVYYIKFIGRYQYADPNKLQKLMIKYSKHLNNLYVSSFSNNFVEIKVLYYGSIIRLFKKVKDIVKTYLNAKVSPIKGNIIIVNVK